MDLQEFGGLEISAALPSGEVNVVYRAAAQQFKNDGMSRKKSTIVGSCQTEEESERKQKQRQRGDAQALVGLLVPANQWGNISLMIARISSRTWK